MRTTRRATSRRIATVLLVWMSLAAGSCSSEPGQTGSAAGSTTGPADSFPPAGSSSSSIPAPDPPHTPSVTLAVPPTSPVSATAPTPADGVVRIDLAARHQTVDGFGISTRVWSDPHLSNAPRSLVPEAAQNEILRLLIDDLGVTRVRPIIEAGIEPVNDNADPAVASADGFDFTGKRTDEHVALVQQARERGVSVWFPSMLQPEPWMTEHTPEEYVERLMAQLLRWEALGSVPPFVSPVNEPSLPIAGGYSEQWLVEVVRALGRRIEQSGLSTGIVIPDDVDPSSGLPKATAVLDDPDAGRYVAAIGYHLYGGDPADRQQFTALGERYDVPVWMTEFSKAEWDSWPAVLEWATTTHRLLTEDSVSAVDYLWGFFGSQERGHSLVSIEFDDGEYRSHAPTAAYWVTGQWSRFVRPGFVRVDATSGPGGAQVSAFVDPDGRQLVIVAVNGRPEALRVPIEVAGGGLGGDIRAIRSSADERWAELVEPAFQDRSFTAELVAESVTTFIVTIAG